jgi:serine/threonine protein kinase
MGMYSDSYESTQLRQAMKQLQTLQQSGLELTQVADFDYLRFIGAGGFGQIMQVRKKSTRKIFAMKIQPKNDLVRATKNMWTGQSSEFHLHFERSVMAECRNSPFIIDLEYAFCTDLYAMLVLELACAGSLDDYIKRSENRRLEPTVVAYFAREIALGIECLHEHGIMHRDIKPANILLTIDGHIKLCDFGLSGRIEEEKYDNTSSEYGAEWTGEKRMIGSALRHSMEMQRASQETMFENLEDLLSEFKVADDTTSRPQVPSKRDMKRERRRIRGRSSKKKSSLDKKLEEIKKSRDLKVEGEEEKDGETKDHAKDHEKGEEVFREVEKVGEGEEEKNAATPVDRSRSTTPISTAPSSASVDMLDAEAREGEDVLGDCMVESQDWKTPQEELRKVKRRTTCGTAGYRAPEQVMERGKKYQERGGYDEMIDWFSLGATCYAMLCGKKPFVPKKEMEYMIRNQEVGDECIVSELSKIIKGKEDAKCETDFEFMSLMMKVPYPEDMDPLAKDFCERLLKRDVEDRMSFKDIKAHSFVKDAEWDEEAASTAPAHPLVEEYIKSQGFEDPNVAKEVSPGVTSRRSTSSKMFGKSKSSGPVAEFAQFPDVINKICGDFYQNQDSEVAERQALKWRTRPNPDVEQLFKNWSFLSPMALETELECAKQDGII